MNEELLVGAAVTIIGDTHPYRGRSGVICEGLHQVVRLNKSLGCVYTVRLPNGWTISASPKDIRWERNGPEISGNDVAAAVANQAEIEKGALQMRIDNAVAELDAIADLLADSEDLPVGQTAAVRLLNETIEALAGLPRSE